MIKTLLFIFLGGGVGAVTRYLIGHFTTQVFERNFPLGTLVSNVLACLLLGLIVYQFNLRADSQQRLLYLFLVVGVCGGLSTFSTFSIEVVELIKQGHVWFALLNIVLSLTFGMGALFFLFKQN